MTITNRTGGCGGEITVASETKEIEGSGQNIWGRNGQEVMTVTREGGKKQVPAINPNDFDRVYTDTIIISHVTLEEEA